MSHRFQHSAQYNTFHNPRKLCNRTPWKLCTAPPPPPLAMAESFGEREY
jgi:hypothetical protein